MKKNKSKEMRHLTDAEKKLSEKNLLKIAEEKVYQDYLKRYNELLINEGIDAEFERQYKERKKELEELNKETLGEKIYNYKKKALKLMLEEGLKLNAERKKKEIKNELKEIEKNLNTLEFQEKTIRSQITNGVEVKNGFRKTHNSK